MEKGKRILVTGGAGFIGSNLVEVLLNDIRVSFIRVLDNLATGNLKNLEEFKDNPKFEFIKGDIRDYQTCFDACQGMDFVSHQAALGSVPRSISDPLTSNDVNISGTLNMFYAAVKTGIKRFVFAASSSTYGDSPNLPKVEDVIGNPLSPYAVTKYVSELYADVFSKTYNFEYIGFRYFNVFGPKQDPNGAYAAVIPLFMKAAVEGNGPTINGDGTFSRDFTYVANAVQANILGMFTKNTAAVNQIYNVAFGQQTSLNELWNVIQRASKTDLSPTYGPTRIGDVAHSLADISKAKSLLGYEPNYDLIEGVDITFKSFKVN